MNQVHNYLVNCRKACSAKELSVLTFHYLKQDCNITLFRHDPFANPLKMLETNNSRNMQYWSEIFNSLLLDSQKQIISNDDGDFYFSGNNFQNETVYIFAVSSSAEIVRDILCAWQSLMAVNKNISQAAWQEAENNYGNLISQFMHDIQSLIDSNKSGENEILRRIDYQRKLNKDLLFYIRDFDLFKTVIPLRSFVEDSMKLIDINPGNIKTIIEDESLLLNIDVELFSSTLNVVISNAVRAADNDLSKIEIRAYEQDSGSPFIDRNWIILEVKDYGNGIAEEFEPFISKPFFTTHKHNGHTGFGLTNAQKIIKAHNGYLDISTGKGTIVKIYIPGKKNEK